jgi:hypothetical protein
VADTVGSTVKITKAPNFLRNTGSILAQYISERPEIASSDEKPKKAKEQTKGKS